MSENSSTRYILEVDLGLPDELHALHNDYLLVPEKFAIPYDMLSDYCKNIADEYEVKKKKKLIPNLYEKTNYLLHYRYHRLCLSLEMKLTKIHKVLKFKQIDWMKEIDHKKNHKFLDKPIYFWLAFKATAFIVTPKF